MNTKTFLDSFNSIETVVNHFVRTLVNIFTFAVTEMAPILAPLPPAFSIYTAMSQRLHAPLYVSLVAALAIEVIGMFSAKISIRCYQWNADRNKTDPAVPQVLSVAMTALFFAVVLLLALTVELLPGLIALVIPGFVLIAISTYINLAIHTNLDKLETDKKRNLDLREEKNGLAVQVRSAKKDVSNLANLVKTAKLELTTLGQTLTSQNQEKIALEAILTRLRTEIKIGQNGAIYPVNLSSSGQIDLAMANEVKQDKIAARRQKLTALLTENSQLTNSELAIKLGVSVGTIKTDKKALNGIIKNVKVEANAS